MADRLAMGSGTLSPSTCVSTFRGMVAAELRDVEGKGQHGPDRFEIRAHVDAGEP